MTWYQQQVIQLESQHICYTTLIKNAMFIHHHPNDADPTPPPAAMWFETREHALRMSVLLRSFLPYQKQSVTQLLSQHYCHTFLWNATVIPVRLTLFTTTRHELLLSHGTTPRSMVTNHHSTLDSAFDTVPPPWFSPIGPWDHKLTTEPVADTMSSYQIVFAAPTMNRTNVGLQYVQQFLDELLEII